MPADKMTNVWPTARMAVIADWRVTLTILLARKKCGVAIDR
jgi:hypothetical protein